jgi:hypothetical protein
MSAAQSTHGGPFGEGLPRRKDAHPEDCAGCASAERSHRLGKEFDALAGKPADATLLAGTAPSCTLCDAIEQSGAKRPSTCSHGAWATNGNGRPMSLEDSAKSAALVAHMAVAGRLGPDDLRVLTWIAERLPFETLRATCVAITAEGSEPALRPDGTLPKKDLSFDPRDRERNALAMLLRMMRALRLLVLGPKAPR